MDAPQASFSTSQGALQIQQEARPLAVAITDCALTYLAAHRQSTVHTDALIFFQSERSRLRFAKQKKGVVAIERMFGQTATAPLYEPIFYTHA